MNQLPMLIRREFWEHQNTFVMLPLVTTGFFVLMMLFVFAASATNSVDITMNWDKQDSTHGTRSNHNEQMESDDMLNAVLIRLERLPVSERQSYVSYGLQSIGAPLLIVLWFVVFFYLLNSLYEDRKDRSILFWKSLPVSDTLTVVAKLITALIVVPLVYLAGIVVLQLVGLILLTVAALNTDIAIWATIWSPANILAKWLVYLGLIGFYSIWALPFYAWLLAVSSYAKSVPLVWAIGVPFALSIAERIVTGRSIVSEWISIHSLPVSFLNANTPIIDNIQSNLFSLQMLSAIVVGGGLVVVAIWLRSRADEI